ncbi:hypothetical protein LSCM1_04738 [Leishmania martiniquensis]|uniref:PB1 domain-containing protein n=1 Tax=Leishmania martiniquensis TaxID=1580590 RepID=A0A836GSV3_9TRYP|nr:hypothetical protein LSCM1_04738 [Leishmania martiniquensis]
MHHAACKAAGVATVTPAPALGANKKHHLSDGNYAKSYGRASYENHKSKHPRPLQPSQEPLKQVETNAAAVPRGSDLPLRPSVSRETGEREMSQPSSACYSDGEVKVSPLTTPSQSYVPLHRREHLGVCVCALQQDAATAEVLRHTSSPLHAQQRHADPIVSPGPLQLPLSDGSGGELQEHAAAGKNMNLSSDAAPPLGGTEAASATVPPLVPKPAPSAETKQRTVNPTGPSANSAPAVVTAASFRRTASAQALQRQLSSNGAAPAPRQQPTSSAVTTGVGRRDGITGARGAPKRSISAKARLAALTTRKQQPNLSSAASDVVGRRHSSTSTPAAAVRKHSAEMDAAVRHQLDQMKAVLDYVAEVTTALSERRRCAAPPHSTKEFRASVIPCRRGGGTNASSEELDGGDLDSPDPTVCARGGGDSVALLPDIHQAAGRLLSTFTKLEYVHLREDVNMPLLERDAVEHSAQLLRLVDAVERHLSLHESVFIRQVLEERRHVFGAMHRLVRFIVHMTHEVVLLRDLALQHDLGQILEVWGGFRAGAEAQSRAAASANDRGTPGNDKDVAASSSSRPHFIFPVQMVVTSPFLTWLEERWLPVMREWRKLVLDALHTASRGDIDGAIRRSRQITLRIDGLEEILRPGETITTLLDDQVIRPIEALAKKLALKRAAMTTLREVLERGEAADAVLSAAELSKALKAAQAVASAARGEHDSGNEKSALSLSGDKEDAALMQRAEKLLARLHEADVLHRASTAVLQQPAPELSAVLDHITRANELLLLWRRAHDVVAAEAAVAVGRAALDMYRQRRRSACFSEGMSSKSSLRGEAAAGSGLTPTRANSGSTGAPVPWIGDGFPALFDVRSLYVTHTSGGPWPPGLSEAYMGLCGLFATLYAKRQARRELEMALARPAMDDCGTRLAGGPSVSLQATPRRSSCDAPSPADTLRVSEEGTNVLGWSLTGSTDEAATARASDGSASRMPNTPKGSSAEELQRCIQQAEEAGVSGTLVEEARARLRRLNTLRLKIHFDAQTRVLPVADASQAAFRDVYQQIHDVCHAQLQSPPLSAGTERRLRIRYEDTDGDFISLLDQQDWHMMLSELAPHGCSGIKIELFCDYPTMPSLMDSGTAAASGDGAQHTGVEWELTSGGFQTESAPETSAPGASANPHGPTAATAATTPEKRTNVFERLASASKVSAATANGPRKPRTLPHSLETSSPQRGPLQPRARGAATAVGSGAVRSVSPQKGAAASRAAAGGGAPHGKDAPSAAAAGVSPLKTAALTAENLRRNLLVPQMPPRPEGEESPAAEELRRSGGQPLSGGMGAAAPPAGTVADGDTSVSLPVGASAARVHSAATESTANGDGKREDSVVHLDLDMARRWEVMSDDELQLLELQTLASLSTVRPDRRTELPETTISVQPTELPSKAEPPRNTFTATHCSGRAEKNWNGGGDGASEAVSNIGEVNRASKRRLADLPSREPRRWSTDAFSLDDVETVCSERSRMPRQMTEPKGPTSLPPRPVNAGVGAGARTPVRLRRGARGTPTRPNAEAGNDDRDGDKGDGANTSAELFAEMQRMREANTRAMIQRKPSWH